MSIIKLYDEPISLVSVAGKYRTGKSFILNKIMGIKGRGVLLYLLSLLHYKLIFINLNSLKLMLQRVAVHKEYGCGQSLNIQMVNIYFSLIQKGPKVWKEIRLMMQKYSPWHY